MSNLTSDEIRQIGCNEWARYMDEYRCGMPSYLRHKPKRTMVASKLVKQRWGGKQNASITVEAQMQA